MPQRPGLYEALTPIENLELHADLRNVPHNIRRERTGELVHRCDLVQYAGQRVGALSGTMKQKLALACALIAMPRLLLLDEPSAALDPLSRRQLLQFLQSLTTRGITVLWSTANFDEAERCAHVLVMNEGRLIAQGSPASLCAPLAGRIHAVGTGGSERRDVVARLQAMAGVGDVEAQGTRVRFSTETPDLALQRFASLGPPSTLVPRLEDSFIALTVDSRMPAPAAPRTWKRGSGGDTIEVRGLSKRFGDFVAVDDVSFRVAPGEIFGLVGPKDAGKTTILRILCGLMSATTGEARIGGRDPRQAAADARPCVGYMNSAFSLYGELSVTENLRFIAEIQRLERRKCRDRVNGLITEFELGPYADTRAGRLPAGVKQLLALAASLVHEPSVVLLDEPTADTDPLTRRDLWRHINALAAEGVAVLVAVPSTEEAEYCDRVMFIDLGSGLATGWPEELKSAVARGDGDVPTLEDAFVARLEERCLRRAA
jgi:ABC-2 type transport system ATP-binding protein